MPRNDLCFCVEQFIQNLDSAKLPGKIRILNIIDSLSRSNTRRGRFREDLLYEGSKKSFGWLFKEGLLDSEPKKIFWMMVQRRSFGWRLKNLLDYCRKKIFGMMNQRKSFGWWSKNGSLDDEPKKLFGWWSKECLLDEEPKKLFWMMVQRRYFGWWSKEHLLIKVQRRSFGWWSKEER